MTKDVDLPTPASRKRVVPDPPVGDVNAGVEFGPSRPGPPASGTRWHFPDGQLYVDLRGYDPGAPLDPHEALAVLLGGLGVGGSDLPLDTDARAARFRSETADRRLLIVLDNAGAVEQLRPLLPGTTSCVVLVTSRDSLAGLVARHGATRLDLDLLPAGDADSLLRGLIGARHAAP